MLRGTVCGLGPEPRQLHGSFPWRTTLLPTHGVQIKPIKLIQIGNSVGLMLPEEVLARLRLACGDTVFLTKLPDGVALTTVDPAFQEQLELGRKFMHEYRDTFRALAK